MKALQIQVEKLSESISVVRMSDATRAGVGAWPRNSNAEREFDGNTKFLNPFQDLYNLMGIPRWRKVSFSRCVQCQMRFPNRTSFGWLISFDSVGNLN